MKSPRTHETNAQIVHKLADISQQSDTLIHDWLVDLKHQYTHTANVNPEEYTHLAHLRQLYIPYVILQLLSVYVRSRHIDADYVNQAIDLSVLVADDQQQIYLDFIDSGRLEEFLQAIFEASALMT